MTPATYARRLHRRAQVRDALAFGFLIAVWLLAWAVFDPAAANEVIVLSARPEGSLLGEFIYLAVFALVAWAALAAVNASAKKQCPHEGAHGDYPNLRRPHQ